MKSSRHCRPKAQEHAEAGHEDQSTENDCEHGKGEVVCSEDPFLGQRERNLE